MSSSELPINFSDKAASRVKVLIEEEENNNLMLANFHSCVETEAEEGENGEERRGLINCPAPQFYDFIENVLCASKLLLLCKLEKLDIIIICFLCMTFT